MMHQIWSGLKGLLKGAGESVVEFAVGVLAHETGERIDLTGASKLKKLGVGLSHELHRRLQPEEPEALMDDLGWVANRFTDKTCHILKLLRDAKHGIVTIDGKPYMANTIEKLLKRVTAGGKDGSGQGGKDKLLRLERILRADPTGKEFLAELMTHHNDMFTQGAAFVAAKAQQAGSWAKPGVDAVCTRAHPGMQNLKAHLWAQEGAVRR
ncbi:MAG: hypothetical protein FJY98_01175 [Candidatus Liptonbacteria bacterium]|nr:hypothetical protein [Candidatus Liptonbacteria bacterium]